MLRNQNVRASKKLDTQVLKPIKTVLWKTNFVSKSDIQQKRITIMIEHNQNFTDCFRQVFQWNDSRELKKFFRVKMNLSRYASLECGDLQHKKCLQAKLWLKKVMKFLNEIIQITNYWEA